MIATAIIDNRVGDCDNDSDNGGDDNNNDSNNNDIDNGDGDGDGDKNHDIMMIVAKLKFFKVKNYSLKRVIIFFEKNNIVYIYHIFLQDIYWLMLYI